jgi:hypothetical protein
LIGAADLQLLVVDAATRLLLVAAGLLVGLGCVSLCRVTSVEDLYKEM